MHKYLDLIEEVLEYGYVKEDRTNTGTKSIFGHQMRFDLVDGFPLLTTKKVHMKSIIHELLWFLQGHTDNKHLKEVGVSIWDEWATAEKCAIFGREEGDLGPIYGKQWRNFASVEENTDSESDQRYVPVYVDQIARLVHLLKTDPNSRRMIVSAWNPADADKVALPPCHTMFQCFTRPPNKRESIKWQTQHPNATEIPKLAIDLQLYQRSADVFLGVPFNIASYALLVHMLAQVCGYMPGTFVWTGGDVHIYMNHMEQINMQLDREVRNLPEIILPKRESLWDYEYEDFQLWGYDPHPAIKAPVAI